jgi:hypothetical protein
MRPLVQAMRRPLFVTLTVKNGPDLRERGEHLRESFGKMRRRVAWQRAVLGGVYIEEVTYNAQDGTWHVHAHLIVDSSLSPEQLMPRLRQLWQEVTGDSYIVDVRPLYGVDLDAALREACKYTAKLSGIVYSPALVGEFSSYANRRRMVIPFGSCYGAAAELAELDTDEGAEVDADVLALPCPGCGEVGHLVYLPGRSWDLAAVVHVGGGWFRPCEGVVQWRQAVAARGSPVIA